MIKAETTLYILGTIFTGIFSQFMLEFLAINSEVIIEKVLIIAFSAIFQFLIIIPYLKGQTRKANEAFFTELKVLRELINVIKENNDNNNSNQANELKETLQEINKTLKENNNKKQKL